MRVPRSAILAVAGAAAIVAALGLSARHREAPAPRGVVEPVEVGPDGRTAREETALRRAAPAGARLARDRDANDTESRRDLELLYADYRPYFVRGDLNGDGRLDLVQAYVTEHGGRGWFDVVVLFGSAGGGFEEPILVERAISLADGDLAVERSLLVVTPDLSRDESRRWRWEPGERRFVDADANPAPETAPDATDDGPDEKPRTRA